MKAIARLIALAVPAAHLLAGCAYLDPSRPPYVIDNLAGASSSIEKSVVGLSVYLRNIDSVAIDSVTGEFFLESVEQANPDQTSTGGSQSTGSGSPQSAARRVAFTLRGRLEPQSTGVFYIPLDGAFVTIPSAVTVDGFSISTVQLNNGRSWSDPLRTFALAPLRIDLSAISLASEGN